MNSGTHKYLFRYSHPTEMLIAYKTLNNFYEKNTACKTLTKVLYLKDKYLMIPCSTFTGLDINFYKYSHAINQYNAGKKL